MFDIMSTVDPIIGRLYCNTAIVDSVTELRGLAFGEISQVVNWPAPTERDIYWLRPGHIGWNIYGHWQIYLWTEAWVQWPARTEGISVDCSLGPLVRWYQRDICGLRSGHTPLVSEGHLWTEAWARWTARTGKGICGRGPRKRWSDRTVGTSVDWGLVTLLVHSYQEGHLRTGD